MGYNSKEEKERAEEQAKQLDALLRKARDTDSIDGMLKLLNEQQAEHQALRKKVVLGISTSDDRARLNHLVESMNANLAEVRLMNSALWHHIYGVTLKAFFHYKKLAEAGNAEAKQIYERLLPLYLAGLLPDGNENGGVN